MLMSLIIMAYKWQIMKVSSTWPWLQIELGFRCCLNSLELPLHDVNVLILVKFPLNCVQAAIHAIGDRANDLILDMYESVFSTNGVRDRRFRVKILLTQTIMVQRQHKFWQVFLFPFSYCFAWPRKKLLSDWACPASGTWDTSPIW